MTKYQEYFKKMLEENKSVFEKFTKAHQSYTKSKLSQEEYNKAGKPIIEIIREYEDRLCNHSEGSGYGAYSGNLADKFWGEVRKEFPQIDRVGIVVKDFSIRKINL